MGMVIGDRFKNHLLKFVRGDHYSIQKQIFSNDLMWFKERSPQKLYSKVCWRRSPPAKHYLSFTLQCLSQ